MNNAYLGGDSSLTCSANTASDVDAEVLQIIKEAHAKASRIINENIGKIHETATFLLEKETITGDECMESLNRDK